MGPDKDNFFERTALFIGAAAVVADSSSLVGGAGETGDAGEAGNL